MICQTSLNRWGILALIFLVLPGNRSVAYFPRFYLVQNENVPDPFGSMNRRLLAYPNPMRDQSRIVFDYMEGYQYRLRLTDVQGRIVKRIENIRAGKLVLQREKLPAGYYYLTIIGPDLFHGKLIIF